MLQQTQASRVAPAYRAFLRRFPDVGALAGARRDEVVRAWDGLGYNRRALRLSEAARRIVGECDGVVPSDPVSLRALPGVGPYTAAAVASIAFGVPVAAVDTNVRRIVSRVFDGADDASVSRAVELAAAWLHRRDPGAWNRR
jgi:A/G-specific adenine glycosylase